MVKIIKEELSFEESLQNKMRTLCIKNLTKSII